MDRLRLNVTRTWGNRTLPTNSVPWRKLRANALLKADNTCRFCNSIFHEGKYMVCDHIDGDASNNDENNLGINCPGCDAFRHCGYAGVKGHIMLGFSSIPQNEIVRMSYDFYLRNGCWPFPSQIDVNAWPVGSTKILTRDGKYAGLVKSPVMFANVLMKYDYDDLHVGAEYIKGFFTPKFPTDFMKYHHHKYNMVPLL